MPTQYTPISQKSSDGEALDFAVKRACLSTPWKRVLLIIGATLVISLCVNLYFIYRIFIRPWELINDLPTQYAGLRRNVSTEIRPDTKFSSTNRTVQNAAWGQVDMEPWTGFLALDEDYTVRQGLPHSQRWPWDSGKGVYIMTSSHELHCVRALRDQINEVHENIPEESRTWHYPHLLHCLDLLRQSVMCNADDTPLYIGRLHKNIQEASPHAGTGTLKMCRDWNQMLQWSQARSACYRPVHKLDASHKEIDRYKWCPDGSRPWEQTKGVHD